MVVGLWQIQFHDWLVELKVSPDDDDPCFLALFLRVEEFELGIGDTAIVRVYVGRFSSIGLANELDEAFTGIDLLTQPPDPAWTYQNYLEMLPEFGLADSFDLDYVLDRVGQFLAIDHPARYREEKRREAEMYKRWREHPDERPSFLRRKRETA